MAAESVQQGETHTFPDVKINRQYVIDHQGRDFILSDGLLDGLHQLSGGYFEVDTRLEQLPTEQNGQLAVCAAKVTVYAPDSDRVVRAATGIGDASPSSVNRMIAPHLVRMAETRALSRALRTLLNVGVVAFEELGPGGSEDQPERRAEASAAPSPPDRILIGGKPYSREQVLQTYRRRLADMRAAGLSIPQTDVLPETAPLDQLVGVSQEWRRRLEARASAPAEAS